MTIRSLAYRTHLMFPRFDGIVEDRGEYTVVRTPSNPTFHWGNFLVFRDAPRPGDLERWNAIFEEEGLGTHRAFGWDEQAPGAAQEFLDAGYYGPRSFTFTAKETNPPPRPNDRYGYRPLGTDAEWRAAIDLQVETREDHFEEDAYRVFRVHKMARYRRMQEAGRGAWFAAFDGDRIVADLGIFREGELARYQSVGTHPDYRRQGICGTLVHTAGQWIKSLGGVDTIVIVAEEDDASTSPSASGSSNTSTALANRADRLHGRPGRMRRKRYA